MKRCGSRPACLQLEPQQQPGRRGNLIELASPQQPEPPQQQQQSYAMMDEQVNLEMLREREQAISKLEVGLHAFTATAVTGPSHRWRLRPLSVL